MTDSSVLFLWSPSLLNDYVECPRRVGLGLWNEKPQGEGVLLPEATSGAWRGNILHKALETAWRTSATSRSFPQQILLETIEQFGANAQPGRRRLLEALITEEDQRFIAYTWEDLQELRGARAFTNDGVWPEHAIESQLLIDAPEGTHRVKGRIDALIETDEGLAIVDYKFGETRDSQGNVLPSILRQFATYMTMSFTSGGETPNRAFLIEGLGSQPEDVTDRLPSSSTILSEFSDLANTAGTASGDPTALVARPSDRNCRWCRERTGCSEWPPADTATIDGEITSTARTGDSLAIELDGVNATGLPRPITGPLTITIDPSDGSEDLKAGDSLRIVGAQQPTGTGAHRLKVHAGMTVLRYRR